MKMVFIPEWADKVRNDPEEPSGCVCCGAIAGCCSSYPNCAGNPDYNPIYPQPKITMGARPLPDKS